MTKRSQNYPQSRPAADLENLNPPSIPPNALDVEQITLGILIAEGGRYLADLEGSFFPEHFYYPEHQIIYRVMMNLYHKSPVDLVVLAAQLQLENLLERVGGNSYLNALVQLAINTAGINQYVEVIKNRYLLRQLLNATSDIRELIFNPKGREVNQILDEAEQKIFNIKNLGVMRSDFIDNEATLNYLIKKGSPNEQEEVSPGGPKLVGLATGYRKLDNLTSGLQKGELVILAARPGMGKTALALSIAYNALKKSASKKKQSIVVFSLEMTGSQLLQRMLSIASSNVGSKIPFYRIRNYDLKGKRDNAKVITKDDEINELYLIAEDLGNKETTPLLIADATRTNVIDIRSKVRKSRSFIPGVELGLIIIDYVQIIPSVPGQSFHSKSLEIGEISRTLKAMALEMEVPILLLSQLNRGVESREDKRPNIADLRESGALEQDADIILLLYREEYYSNREKLKSVTAHLDNPTNLPANTETAAKTTPKGLTEVNVAKNRNGATGLVKLIFEQESMYFRDYDE